MTHKKSYLHLSIVLLLVCASLGGYIFLYTKVQKESVLANTLSGELQARSASGSQNISTRSTLEALVANETLIEKYFVSTADIVPFLERLEGQGKELGTTVEVVSVSADAVKPSGHLNLSLRIQGSFTNVLRTLGVFEYQEYDTLVKSLTLDTQETGVWTATTVLVVGTIPAASTTKARIEASLEKAL